MLFLIMIKRLAHLLLFFIPIIGFSQVTYNFESGDLSGWTQVPDARWAASPSTPIDGSYSLKHTYDNTAAATDRLSVTLPLWDISSGSVTWQVKVRHGYDPSSSNRWWVVLMSNQDATQMLPGGTYSGYAIGVNLTGSDDLLKLWRIDNGTPQVVIASTLNWQTQIGKTTAGAIAVERKTDGTFTLKASVSGSFSNLASYGSAVDNNHTDFDYFGICYNYSANYDQLLWVDDISFIYIPQNTNDLTSEVLNPTIQIGAGSIPSTSISSSLAVDVMRFEVRDNSTSDNLPTRVKKVMFKKASSSNAASWISTIGGARLRNANGEVSILNQTISEDHISLEVDSAAFTVLNGETKEYTLSLYLKPDNLSDGSTVRVMVDSINHGFESGVSGSDFLDILPNRIVSNEFTVGVTATSIKFLQVPISISKNTPFTLSVAGTDNSGNLDKDYVSSISLSLSQGSGIVSSPSGLTKPPTLGISTWSDLNYSAKGKFRIRASSSGFLPIETDEIYVLGDSTSTINQPVSQPAGVAISSLSYYPAKAVEVLKFTIYDFGNTDDSPTIVKNIKISRVEMSDAASLSKSIGGILMLIDGNPVSISKPDIKTGYLTFTTENLVVADGEYKDVSIWVYLKDQGLTDNQKIQLKIDSVNHGFIADPNGSTFRTIFPKKITSNIFWIDVVATDLKFSSAPARVGVQEPFSVTLSATDTNGNIDKSFSGTTNLSLLTGGGTLITPSGFINSILSGVCTYDSLAYSKPERFSLLASSATLNSVSSSLITCGDADGGIIPLSNPQNPVSVNSTSINAENAVEVIGLNVFDAGSTDGLPLIISKISLNCFDPSKAEQLNRQIGGFVIKADGRIVEVESYSLYDGVFEINPKPESLIVPDGDTIALSLSIYLTQGGVIDNFPFQFYIPTENHGWESSSVGTGFANSFTSTVYGHECTIDIAATSLRFDNTPFVVSPLQGFDLKACTTDTFGSVDNDYSDQLALSLDYGTGSFTCLNTNQSLTAGYAEWSDVALDTIGTYRFKVNGTQLGNSYSDKIFCGIDYNCLVRENFEGTLNSTWVGVSDWSLSTISPINGSKSLQHKQGSGVSKLSIPADFPPIGEKYMEWKFTLRNGSWNPSTDNNFFVALMTNSSDLASDTTSGYFVGVNPSLSNNFLNLWRIKKGIKTSLITSDFSWGSDDEITVKVGLTPKGEWKLWYMPKDYSRYILAGECNCFTDDTMGWCGPVFNYTSTRSGLLWLDDLRICTSDYPPVLISAKVLNLNTVKVQFSRAINSDDATKIASYSIIDSSSNFVNIISTSILSGNEVILKTNKIPFGKLMLKVSGIRGLNGLSVNDSICFGLGEQGAFGRLVLNEIMASPESTNGLPAFEYIELYNPSNDTILLNGWRLTLNSYSLTLPADSILPNQYAILCSTSAVEAMSVYGKTVGVTSFPALLNGGMMLKLFDPSGSLISLVTYSDSWYGDDLKKEGGWSLERIDYQNLMEGKNNWRASNSAAGGTPCTVNSVAAANPDITSPRVLSLEVVSDSTILLQFSEPMDSLMLTYTNNYVIDNGISHPSGASLVGGDYSMALLVMPAKLSSTILYSLCFGAALTDFSGNHLISDCMLFSLPQVPLWNDIVINEVLFNPNTGGVDFVEIYNRSDKTFDLSKISLSNRNSSTNGLDQVNSITDTSKLLFPQNYGVITTNPELVKLFYRTEGDKAFIRASSMASFNIDEGHVVLLSSALEVIDEFHYTESMHSQLLNDFKGVSLERINPDFESSSSSTWHSAAQTVGYATPTYKNSQWVEPSTKDDEFSLSPETFSPDGDGRDDFLLISYKLPSDGSVANIRVFDSGGREVRRLASNLLIGTEGEITWDGLNGKNQRVPVGIYIVYIEYFNPNGAVKKYKKTCVVAEKL